MQLDQSTIDEIVRRVLSVSRPDRIILFGSAAHGTMTQDSDVDLLVLEEDPGNTREESARIGGAMYGLNLPVDVIVLSTFRFEETKGVVGGIAYPANKHGRVIYEGT